MLTPNELKAFSERAEIEIKGKDGQFEIDYLDHYVVVHCEKGKAKKIAIKEGGKIYYERI